MATKKKELSDFDGREVVGATIALTNAGDGLSKAMAVAPAEFHHGDRVYVVIETECAKVRFDKSKDDPNRLLRVHTLKAGVSTVVDETLVAQVLDEQRKRNEAHEGKERIEGLVEPDHSKERARRERVVSDGPVPISRAAQKALDRAAKARADAGDE